MRVLMLKKTVRLLNAANVRLLSGIKKRRRWIIPVLALGFLLSTLLLLNALYPLNLPHENSLFARLIVDERGRPLRAFADREGVWRYPLSLDQVSPLYLEALLTYEDRWFWYHPGVNPFALLRACFQNIVHGEIVSGGSTLSMQVARLLHPHPRTLAGKGQQLLRTLQLEWQLDKKEILNIYLNIAPFGGTIEGVQAASYTYLNKSAATLSHAEAALLAVLPQSPTRYRPDKHSETATKARNKVLDRMFTQGRWSEERVADAKLESVYAYRARRELVAPLLARRLLKNSDAQQAIKTTINGQLQRALEAYVKTYIHRLPARTSAAILVVDNQSAEVKAYLGSANFTDDSRFGHVDMIQAIRSPGSTLKPFLFALAMDEGLIHSHSLMADVPRSWGEYRPSNFSQHYSGPVSASEALQRSLNIPFIDLLERYGPKRFATVLKGAGLSLKIPTGEPNLAVILGGAGTSLEQLVVAYMAFARDGKTLPLKYVQQANSAIEQPRYFFSPGAAWITQRTLSSITRPGSLNTVAAIKTRQNMAWKTGTSFGYRDTWAIGVSKKYTIGVWIGRPDGTPIPGHNGRQTAGPLLFAVADHLQLRAETITQPASVTQQEICWPLGIPTPSSEQCHQGHTAWVLDETLPPTWHQGDNDTWQENPMSFWVNAVTHLRVNKHCGLNDQSIIQQKKVVALWPKILEPWLAKNLRRHHKFQRRMPVVVKIISQAQAR